MLYEVITLLHGVEPRRKRSHPRVLAPDDPVETDRAGAHQHIGDFQRLLAGIGLRHQQIIDVDAELVGIGRVERMLGVDEVV